MSEQPKESNAKEIAYEKVLATFFDVLGFKALIKNASPSAIHRLLSSTRKVSEPNGEFDKDDCRIRSIAFSDSVMRCVPLDSNWNNDGRGGLLYYELWQLAWVQSHIVCELNAPIRGALVLGDLFLKDGITFGEALVHAYQLESQHACYPRIIIDHSVEDEFCTQTSRIRNRSHTFEKESACVSQLSWVDFDGRRFVDYLGDHDEFQVAPENVDLLIHEHCNLIINESQKSRDDERLLKKFHWMASYHNAIVTELSGEGKLSDENNKILTADEVPRFDGWDKAPPTRRALKIK